MQGKEPCKMERGELGHVGGKKKRLQTKPRAAKRVRENPGDDVTTGSRVGETKKNQQWGVRVRPREFKKNPMSEIVRLLAMGEIPSS